MPIRVRLIVTQRFMFNSRVASILRILTLYVYKYIYKSVSVQMSCSYKAIADSVVNRD